nr:MAG TPA: hypothetical protein [Caudoviricetes sp.]
MPENGVVSGLYRNKKSYCKVLIYSNFLHVGVAGFEPTTPCSQSVIWRFLPIFRYFYFVL